MPDLKHKDSLWPLALFPLAQLILFAGSVATFSSQLMLSLLLLVAASIAFSFNIHIFIHECAHRRTQYPAVFYWFASIMIGLPFDGYRIHHFNHHRFENGHRDFSTTWIHNGHNSIPRSVLSYCLGWPRQLLAGMGRANPFAEPGAAVIANAIKARIPAQKKILVLTILLMAVVSWQLLLLYSLLVYFGWALTSLQNYGQHPPTTGNPVSTFAHPVYNRLFFNNGLHWEHHRYPKLHWHELALRDESIRITHTHLIHPLR